MFSILLLAISSFVFALLLTPICRSVFSHFGVVDHPDLHRKLHTSPTPRAGGLAITLAYVAAFGVLLIVPFEGKNILLDGSPLVLRLVPAAAVVFVTGLLDDTLGLKPWQKLVGQFVGALLALGAGVHIQGIGGLQFSSWWSMPLTIFWLLACTNAFNLIDGLDGLAAGIGAFAALTTMTAALMQDHVSLAMATAPLVGALLGFLRYNFQPASVFLGDTGSLLIGFMLGCYGVLWSHKADTIFGMTAPMMVVAIPLLDTGLAIGRRFIRGKPIFAADRGHIHHRLLDSGLTPRRATLSIYVVCTIAAILSLITSLLRDTVAGLAMVVFCGVALMLIRYLRYVEFSILGRFVSQGMVLNIVSGEIALADFENRLASAGSIDQLWHVVCDASNELGFSRIELWTDGRLFDKRFEATDPTDTVVMRIALPGGCYAECERSIHNNCGAIALASYCRILRRFLMLHSGASCSARVAAM